MVEQVVRNVLELVPVAAREEAVANHVDHLGEQETDTIGLSNPLRARKQRQQRTIYKRS